MYGGFRSDEAAKEVLFFRTMLEEVVMIRVSLCYYGENKACARDVCCVCDRAAAVCLLAIVTIVVLQFLCNLICFSARKRVTYNNLYI